MAKTKEQLLSDVHKAQSDLAAAQAAFQLEREAILRSVEEIKVLVATEKTAAEKTLKTANDGKDMWYRKSSDLEAEIAMTHLVLDTLTGAPPRELKAKPDAYSATQLTLVARLAGYLAFRP